MREIHPGRGLFVLLTAALALAAGDRLRMEAPALALAEPASPSDSRTESFFVDLPGDLVAATHSGRGVIATGPAGIPLLSERLVRNGLAVVVKVRDATGEIVGFASELEVFPADADMVKGDVIWNTDWTLVLPGRGTIFLHQQEHSGELGTKVLLPTSTSGLPWEGDWSTVSTYGPARNGRGIIAGGSGEFSGATGTFVESIRLRKFTPEGLMFGKIRLEIERGDPT